MAQETDPLEKERKTLRKVALKMFRLLDPIRGHFITKMFRFQ